ncbi:Hypothetical protein NocV09_00700480 [Nannochloropsis oceanica]
MDAGQQRFVEAITRLNGTLDEIQRGKCLVQRDLHALIHTLRESREWMVALDVAAKKATAAAARSTCSSNTNDEKEGMGGGRDGGREGGLGEEGDEGGDKEKELMKKYEDKGEAKNKLEGADDNTIITSTTTSTHSTASDEKTQQALALFRYALLQQATKLSDRLRKIGPPRHEETRQARLVIKAVALYLLWLRSGAGTEEGQCERVKVTAKVAIDLYGAAACETEKQGGDEEEEEKEEEKQGGFREECVQAATLCVDTWRALGEGEGGREGGWAAARGMESEAVVVAASKSVEVLLDLIWKRRSTERGRKGGRGGGLTQKEAQEVTRLTVILLEIASAMPKLLLKRAITVASDMGRRLVRQRGGGGGRGEGERGGEGKGWSAMACHRQARDIIIATLQTLEPLLGSTNTTTGSNSNSNSNSSSNTSDSTHTRASSLPPCPPRWVLLTRASLLWLLSDVYSQLHDLGKALLCLQELESLQQTHACTSSSSSSSSPPLFLAQPKLELAKVSYLLRGGTEEGQEGATIVILRLVDRDLPSALKGARALIACGRYHPQTFAVFDSILTRCCSFPSSSSSSSFSSSGGMGGDGREAGKEKDLQAASILLEQASLLGSALQATSSTHPPSTYQALISRLLSTLTPLLLPSSPFSSTRVSFPLSLSPSLLTETDRNTLKSVLQKALWHTHSQAYNTLPTVEEGEEGREEGNEGRSSWHTTQRLCDLLLAVTSAEDEGGKESVLCTKAHAVWEEGGREEEAVAVAREACEVRGYRSEKARLNLFWLSTLMAMREGGREGGGKKEEALLGLMKELVAGVEGGVKTEGGRSGRKKELLEALESMARVVAETMMSEGGREGGREGEREGGREGRSMASRILKTILAEALRLCRAFFEATLSCYHIPIPSSISSSSPSAFPGARGTNSNAGEALSSSALPPSSSLLTYPQDVFSLPDAAVEIWRGIVTFALPALDAVSSSNRSNISSPKNSTEEEGGGEGGKGQAAAAAAAVMQQEDLKWFKALCMNFGIAAAAAATTTASSSCSLSSPSPSAQPQLPPQNFFVAAHRFHEAVHGPSSLPASSTIEEDKHGLLLLFLAITSSLSSRSSSSSSSSSSSFSSSFTASSPLTLPPSLLTPDESIYYLSQITRAKQRLSSFTSSSSSSFSSSSSKLPSLTPLFHNLRVTALLLEVLIRASSSSPSSASSSSRPSSHASSSRPPSFSGREGGKEDDPTLVLPALIRKEHITLLSLPFEVLHALARLCLRPSFLTSPTPSLRTSALALFRLALQKQQQPQLRTPSSSSFSSSSSTQSHSTEGPTKEEGREGGREKALWVYLDLYHAVGSTRASLEIVKEFQAEAKTGFLSPTPTPTLLRVASRLAAALYNEGVGKLEMMSGGEEGEEEGGAEACLEASLALLSWSEESFKKNYSEQIESMLAVCRELKEVDRKGGREGGGGALMD